MIAKDTRQGMWVVRQSARGYTYHVWRRGEVPLIPQRYLDSSIYLYDSKMAAEAGENFGGSGCLVHVYSPHIFDPKSFKQGRYHKALISFPPHIYAVTNRHVVEAGYTVIRLNTIDDEIDVLELEQEDWILHPEGDDLAVAAIDLPQRRHKYHPLDPSEFITRHTVTELGAGDDTFMVGRFISHAGMQRNTPSLRFGSIAMLPFEKVRLASGHMQEAFLVETRSISGYSGSPVFVYRPVQKKTTLTVPYERDLLRDPHGNDVREFEVTSITDPVGRPLLLGVDCGHVLNYEDVLDAGGKAHPYGWKVATNTGMAIVIPAWRLNDLLNIEELVMQRKQKDERYRQEKEAEQQNSSVAFDVKKKPEIFTAEDYTEALRRASRKVNQPDEEKNEE
jgi:hypothetical protein